MSHKFQLNNSDIYSLYPYYCFLQSLIPLLPSYNIFPKKYFPIKEKRRPRKADDAKGKDDINREAL